MSARDDEFSIFVGERGPALYRTAYFLMAGDRPAAQDLVQDALADAFARWGAIRDAQAREPYVRRIMVRAATRRWDRRRRSLEVLGADLPEPPVDGHAEDVESASDLARALSRLSPRQRAVVVLRYYHDFSEAQIAEAMSCSRGAVKTHGSRGLRALQADLAETDYAPAVKDKP
jgi:RNA polymerase sigma-70 factor (sigma-E family)